MRGRNWLFALPVIAATLVFWGVSVVADDPPVVDNGPWTFFSEEDADINTITFTSATDMEDRTIDTITFTEAWSDPVKLNTKAIVGTILLIR